MEDLYVTGDIVKMRVDGVLRGEKIVDRGQNPDGSYFVKIQVPLYGSTGGLALAVFSVYARKRKNRFRRLRSHLRQFLGRKSGLCRARFIPGWVVVDASSLGLEPNFSPIIYDTNGRAVYGIENIETSVAINSGMVGYADAVEEAASGSRAGITPSWSKR